MRQRSKGWLMLARARGLRREQTDAEEIMWEELRGSQLDTRFRRQEPIGPYIVDFVSIRSRLVIEIDGATHEDEDADAVRDRWLQGKGFQVLRFTNEDVFENREGVLDTIWYALHGEERDST